MDLLELRKTATYTRHPLYKFYRQFNQARIADRLGICKQNFNAIICGRDLPSAKLEIKMYELSRDIERAQLDQELEGKPPIRPVEPANVALKAKGKV